jgi:uncharacterized protein YbcC (UPF0753/DUF2309 family)
MINLTIQKSIEEASQVVGKTWPLYSFVTSNRYQVMRECHLKSSKSGTKILNANVFPESTVFRQAWEKGEIDENILKLLGKSTVRIS